MSNQFLKLRRSAVPGKTPDTASLDFGEIALNTYDGLAFMKKSGSNGVEIVTIGSTAGAFTGSFSGSFSGSLLGTASYALNAISASYLSGSTAIVDTFTSSFNIQVNNLSIGVGRSTGSNNIAIGSGSFVSSGDANIAIGNFVLTGSQIGSYNTAVGHSALSVFTGSLNTAFGSFALFRARSGTRNTAIGQSALPNLLDGSSNTAVGDSSMFFFVSGAFNTALGSNALADFVSGSQNTALGSAALRRIKKGTFNLAVGAGTLRDFLEGDSNTILGTGAVQSIFKTGSNNTIVGFGTGNSFVTGSNNTILGANISGLSTELNNNIIISDGQGSIKARHSSSIWNLSGSIVLPNITNADQVDVVGYNTTTGQLYYQSTSSLNVATSSYAATASSADNFLVRGTLTAQTIVAQVITSSTEFITGSTRFGSSLSDTHQFTGSVSITGSLNLNGTSSVVGNGSSGQVTYWTGATSQTGSNNLFWDNANGRLGIGTNAPAFPLHLAGISHISTQTAIHIQVNGANPYIASSGANSFQIRNTSGFDVTNFSASTTFARFTSGGNLLLGSTTDGGQRLQVSGSAIIGASTSGNKLNVFGTDNEDILTVNWGGSNSIGLGSNTANNPVLRLGVIKLTAHPAGSRLILSGANGRFGSGDGELKLWGSVSGTSTGTIVWLGSRSDFDASGHNPTSGTLNVVGVLPAASTNYSAWNPSSGNATFNVFNINPTINTSGTYSGIVRGIYYNPTLTSITGVTNRAIETVTGDVLLGTTSGNVGIGISTPFSGSIVNPSLEIGNGNLTVRGYAVLGPIANNGYGAVGSNYYLDSSNALRRKNADSVSTLEMPVGGFRFSTAGNGAANSVISLTELMRLNANGNLLLGSTTDGGQKLQVTGTSIFSGDATFGTSTNYLSISNNSAGTNPKIISAYWNGATPYGIQIRTNITTDNAVGNGYGLRVTNPFNSNYTSGTYTSFELGINQFNPTSGTGIFNALQVSHTINQTGGANGITRGLYVNPVLTSAADWRSLEWSNNTGRGLYGAGTAANVLSGSTTIGSLTTGSATFNVVGTTNLNGNTAITGSVNITGSLRVTSSFIANGLTYPTADNGAKSFMQTDGAGNLSLQYVKTMYEEVKSRESVTIPKGAALYVDGNTGPRADVYLADAYNPARRPATLIAADTITPNGNGLGIVLGLIEGVDVGSLTAGTDVYLSSSGQWTGIRPDGDTVQVQLLGTVSRPGNNGAGYVLNPGPYNLPNIQSGYTWVGNSSSFPIAVPTASLSVATASFAQTIASGLDITASNLLVINSITASSISAASASFGYVQTITGSAVIIGQEYIILNTQSPSARYAGLKIYDSGSNYTASIVWDSETNHFVYENSSGSSYSGGGFMAGPRNTGSLSDVTYPTLNRILRGQGGDHLYDSNIVDDNTSVKVQIPLEVTGSTSIVSSGDGLLVNSPNIPVNVRSSVSSTTFYGNAAGSSTTAIELASSNVRRFRILANTATTTFESSNQTGGFIFNKGADIYGNLYVSGSGRFDNNLIVTGSLVVTGSANVTGISTFSQVTGYNNSTTDGAIVLNNPSSGHSIALGVTSDSYLRIKGPRIIHVGAASNTQFVIEGAYISSFNSSPGLRLGTGISTSTVANNNSIYVSDSITIGNTSHSYNMLRLLSPISSSVVNGLARGVYVSPTFSGSIDFRAIQWDNTSSFGLYGSGSAPNVLSGSTTIGSLTTGSATFNVIGTTNLNGNTTITGSLNTSGSVNIKSSGSAVFSVDGTSGRLFQVDDSLSGSLFSVNTAAGLPVIEAFSDNTVRIGQFGQRAFFVSQSSVGIGKESNLNGKLDVSGSASITGSLSVIGSGNTSGTTALTVQNSDGTNILNIRNDGSIQIGNRSATLRPYFAGYTGYSEFGAGQSSLGIVTQFLTTSRPDPGVLIKNSANLDFTSGTANYLVLLTNYSPTSGTGTLANFQISSTINQTGGANGITRGLYITPTLTSAASWRSIEWSNNTGFGLYGSGSAPNVLLGNTTIGSLTTGSATFNVVGTTNFSGSTGFTGSLDITGSLNVGGTITATTLVVQTVTSSVVYSSGSNIFGSQLTDIQQFTGSLRVTGSGDHWVLGGNVGIGTTSPTQKLHVSGGNALIGGNIFFGDANHYLATDNSTYAMLSSNRDLQLARSGNPALTINSSRNVGIGTTSPTAKLHIQSGSAAFTPNSNADDLFIETSANSGITVGSSASGTGNIYFGDGGSNAVGRIVYDHSGDSMLLWANSSERVRIDSSGSVGIGTSTPITALDVSGSIRTTSGLTSTGSIAVQLGSGYTGLLVADSTSFRLKHSNSGDHIAINANNSTTLFQPTTAQNSLTVTPGGNSTTLGFSATVGAYPSAVIGRFISGSVTVLSLSGSGMVGTGSFNYLGNIAATSFTGSAAIISGSGTNRLTVIGSGSAQPIFTVQGSQGELFSITDSLSGSLFSVNDISGLPIVEVFSDNTMLMGSYLAPSLNTTVRATTTNSGSFTIYSVPTASYDGLFMEYTARSGSNARAGQFMAIWSGSSVNFTDNSTTDFGNTSRLAFTGSISGSVMTITGNVTVGSGWTVKSIIRSI